MVTVSENLNAYTIHQLLAELARRNTLIAIGDRVVRFDNPAQFEVRSFTDERTGKKSIRVEIFGAYETPTPPRKRPLSSPFDSDQYFLDLVAQGIPADRARRLANLAADVDALAGSLAKGER